MWDARSLDCHFTLLSLQFFHLTFMMPQGISLKPTLQRILDSFQRVSTELLRCPLPVLFTIEAFLRETLPHNHLIFNTPLLTDSNALTELSSYLVSKIPEPQDDMQSTGVPPHVMLLNEI